ncbi:MAG TPA: hypothetical protein VGU25_17650 [Acidobacteriaceae bacterium]|nr:hypothetical protein [Acidobacteriaceae bacterium]
MASANMQVRLATLEGDLRSVQGSQNFIRIRNDSSLFNSWVQAQQMASQWLSRIKPLLAKMDDSFLQPLEVFSTAVVNIGDGGGLRPNEAIRDAIWRATSEFQPQMPLLAFRILEQSGILDFSEQSLATWKTDAMAAVQKSVEAAKVDVAGIVVDARDVLKATAVEAGKDFELAKERASRISVDSAERQFIDAAKVLRKKATIWASLVVILFVSLAIALAYLFNHPPALINSIEAALAPGSKTSALPVSVPLLLAASAYFTGLRLALVGVLGIGLAFSLRMTRAYFHMIEHNQHKLRVTRSIEAFVAAVRTSEQKDLVLSKLVESVTEFGDSGILGKEESPNGLPSVVFEAITKNFNKSE